jgi:sugar-specific transcriptional regulator TrmB
MIKEQLRDTIDTIKNEVCAEMTSFFNDKFEKKLRDTFVDTIKKEVIAEMTSFFKDKLEKKREIDLSGCLLCMRDEGYVPICGVQLYDNGEIGIVTVEDDGSLSTFPLSDFYLESLIHIFDFSKEEFKD